mgnify:CR=1 FL=1
MHYLSTYVNIDFLQIKMAYFKTIFDIKLVENSLPKPIKHQVEISFLFSIPNWNFIAKKVPVAMPKE